MTDTVAALFGVNIILIIGILFISVSARNKIKKLDDYGTYMYRKYHKIRKWHKEEGIRPPSHIVDDSGLDDESYFGFDINNLSRH